MDENGKDADERRGSTQTSFSTKSVDKLFDHLLPYFLTVSIDADFEFARIPRKTVRENRRFVDKPSKRPRIRE